MIGRMKVPVTGATGTIGGAAADALTAASQQVARTFRPQAVSCG